MTAEDAAFAAWPDDADTATDNEWLDDEEPQREAFVAAEADEGQRLDRVLVAQLPELSRTYVRALIDGGQVSVDGRQRKASYRLHTGEQVEVQIPPPASTDLVPEAIPLSIVYEDADVIVIDKPVGLVVHPAPGHARGTVVNAVLAHAPEMQINGSQRPGIVHRIDKDTSGLLIVAKHERAMAALVAQFQARQTLKIYLTLVDGVVEPDEGTIDVPIGRDPRNRQRMAPTREGRSAISHFRVLERFAHHTLLEVRIESGRTHQIRVHCAFIGHPVVGDSVYGNPKGVGNLPLTRQFLHATRLGLRLPNGERREFTSPLPPDLERPLATLRAALL